MDHDPRVLLLILDFFKVVHFSLNTYRSDYSSLHYSVYQYIY